MTIPNVLITPRRTALLAGHDNDLQVLVRIQAPQAPDGSPPRAPLHLSLVIDRSGSMSGEPLDHAKRCAGFMLDGLTPTDRLSVVSFDEHVTTLSPATLLADKSGVSRAIRDIVAGGMTNLHGGWLQGAETLAPHTSAATISRVILLSDGNANVGIVDAPRILEQCAELANAGVTTSTYGLGRKFNEDLMIGMARHGQGHSYYGSTANDLMDPFREEFALLNATCARYLQLEIDATSGIGVTMLNEYIAAGSATPATAWCLPDLAYGGEAWALVHLRISRDRVDAAQPEALIHVRVRYTGLDGEPRAIAGEPLALPVVSAAAFDAIADDELVARRAGEIEAARLQQQARDAARSGDWASVHGLIARATKVAEHNPWVRDSIDELRAIADRADSALFSKEASFQAHRMQTRLAARDEANGSHRFAKVAAYLRRKTNQGKGDEQPPP